MVHANFFTIFILAAIQVASLPLPFGDKRPHDDDNGSHRPTKRHQASHASSSTGQHNEHIESLIKTPPSFLHLNNGMLDASAHTTVPDKTVYIHPQTGQLSHPPPSVSTGQTTHVNVHPNPQAHQSSSHSPPSVSTGQTSVHPTHLQLHQTSGAGPSPQPSVDLHFHPSPFDHQSPSHSQLEPSVDLHFHPSPSDHQSPPDHPSPSDHQSPTSSHSQLEPSVDLHVRPGHPGRLEDHPSPSDHQSPSHSQPSVASVHWYPGHHEHLSPPHHPVHVSTITHDGQAGPSDSNPSMAGPGQSSSSKSSKPVLNYPGFKFTPRITERLSKTVYDCNHPNCVHREKKGGMKEKNLDKHARKHLRKAQKPDSSVPVSTQPEAGASHHDSNPSVTRVVAFKSNHDADYHCTTSHECVSQKLTFTDRNSMLDHAAEHAVADYATNVRAQVRNPSGEFTIHNGEVTYQHQR